MQQQNGLPLLQGSPKQIAWAEAIRQQCLEQLQAELAIHLQFAPPTRQSAAARLEQAARRIVLRQPQEAAWWIERRKRLLVLLQGDIAAEATRLADEYRTYLLASIRQEAEALGRAVRADVESLSLDELATEEAILLRLAGIQHEARALGPWPSTGLEK